VSIVRIEVSTALGAFVVEATPRGVRQISPWTGPEGSHPAHPRRAEPGTGGSGPRRAAASQDGERRGPGETLGGLSTGHAPATAHARSAAEALQRYAAGGRARFDGRLDLEAPAFQRAVWERLRMIRFGATTTYGEIAAALGMPGEARAVGAAVGANPIAVLVPCHRVVGADGSLKGFAWGLDLKRRLLAHEGSAVIDLFV
jgi:methylated-DNA-[protein]-cysteine S-methyltransferase